WRQLLPPDAETKSNQLAYPDAEFPAADIEARLILCDIFSRQFEQAERKLFAFRRKHGDASGSLAGRDGRLSEILAQVLTEADEWQTGQIQSFMPTFGGSRERQRSWNEKLDLGPVLWSAGWTVRSLPQFATFPPFDRGPLKSFPVVDQDHVFLSDGD